MTHLKEYRQATEITALFLFCISLFHPILGPYAKSLGLTEFQIGLMFALFPLTLILTCSTFGSLSDSIGRKKIIILGIIMQIAGIILYLIGKPYLIIIARFLEALAFGAVVFVGLAKIQDNLRSKTRGKYSGITLSIMHIGTLIAPVAGGFLADYWFIKAPFIFSMLALLLMLWLISIHESLNLNHKFTRSDFNIFEKVRMFFSNKHLRGMGVLGIVMHASVPLIYIFIPIYIVDHFGLSYRYVGYALFAMHIFMLFQFFIGSLCDRLSKAKLMLFGVVTFGIFMFFLAWAPTYWFFILGMFLLGISLAFWNVAAWSFMADIGAKMKREGFVIGTYISVAKIGSFFSFIFGGMLAQYYGVPVLMAVIGALVIVGAIAAAFFVIGNHKKGRKKK
ncbi:MFS transporter [Candidatus Woesearchaeota archaeon]|jgi:MFS family permease|nr:MFS transporter [Candidatus Woesearchaeota archaeon]